MTLHSTLSELHFKKSLIHFLNANLTTIQGYSLFYNPQEDPPIDSITGDPINQWIVVTFDNRTLTTLASAYIVFDLYSMEDDQGLELSLMTDALFDIFIDETNTNGTAIIPFYDTTNATSWELIGGIIPIHKETRMQPTEQEDLLIRSITFRFCWGAK